MLDYRSQNDQEAFWIFAVIADCSENFVTIFKYERKKGGVEGGGVEWVKEKMIPNMPQFPFN